MKKFFLIPLLTLVCSVMAWGGATITVGEGGDQTSLAAAINAASAGDKLQLVSDLTVSSEVDFNKNLTVDFNGHTITATDIWLITVNANLTLEATNGGGITAPKGCLDVYGSSKVTINGGTFTTTVNNSGAAIWGNYNSCQLEFNNGTIHGESAGIVFDGGHVVINGGSFYSEYSVAVEVKGGYFEINDGEFVDNSSTKHMVKTTNGYDSRSYAVMAENCTFVMNGGTISGVHGGLTVDGASATINGGVFETRACAYGGASHYALYVCTHGVANVYGGKFKSYDKTAMLCGNNDVTPHLGVINFYGGKTATKATVSKVPSNNDFPASIPATSQWYSSITIGSDNYGDAPLPAGYEYYDITEGEDYEAGYRYGVRAIASKEADGVSPAQQAAQEADPTYTIPWQQATTWKTAEVPEDNTIVTIPKDATVTVSNAEATKTAVADQVFVNQGATLKVETGTTLNIGEGGMNIGNGGQIVVEPGAVVTVGDAGIITTEDEALVIESSEQQQGVLLLDPEVNENTQPQATVKLTTKAKQIAANDYIYERFAIPTIDGNATVYGVEDAASVVLYPGETELKHGLYKWDGSDWAFMSSFKQMEPFKGYQLTNNSANADVVYTFEGNLVGNHNEDYSFASAGFGFFGNSYTGAIDIKKFMDSFGDEMQKTIWIYDYYTDGFKTITPESYGTVKYGTRKNSHGAITEIRSMQAFLMNRSEAGSTTINYESAIWGNPKYGLVSTPDPAPAKRVAANEDKVTIYVATDTQEDEVTLIRSNEYSSAFDNGADASKWMNNGMNLYVVNGDENMAIVASDEIADMTIAFRSGNESEYTLGFDNLRGETFELRDVLTGATIQMTEGATYTFSQEANTTVPARFQIIGARKVATGVENESEGAAVQQKVIENGVLYILRDNKWYNAQGQMVK